MHYSKAAGVQHKSEGPKAETRRLKGSTSNIQHRTSNIQWRWRLPFRYWMLDVGCSPFFGFRLHTLWFRSASNLLRLDGIVISPLRAATTIPQAIRAVQRAPFSPEISGSQKAHGMLMQNEERRMQKLGLARAPWLIPSRAQGETNSLLSPTLASKGGEGAKPRPRC